MTTTTMMVMATATIRTIVIKMVAYVTWQFESISRDKTIHKKISFDIYNEMKWNEWGESSALG